jgi:phospholipid/cholesterol/gamma-HCH transport system substrate-binding protein
MARRPAQDATVGAVFALALIVFALAVMVVGGESAPWSKQSRYSVVFRHASGLRVGAPVRMAGVEIGMVTEIDLPTDPGQVGIEVQVGIDSTYSKRVREDSHAALRLLQILTNEKFVEIEPGSPESPLLPSGSRIQRLEEVGVVERGEAIAESLGEILIALKNILGPIERGQGLIGELLHDPEFGKKGLEALRGTLENLDQLTGDLAAGQGALGRLLYDESLAARVDQLGRAIENLSSLAQALADGEGAIGALLDPAGAAHQAVLDLSDSAASIKRITTRLENQEGFVGRLLNDPEYSNAMADDLQGTLGDLAEIVAKINRGEGALGALVNDRALYDGAEDVFAGVNDSKFARWLTRHYRKKGIRAQEQAEQEAEPQDPGP